MSIYHCHKCQEQKDNDIDPMEVISGDPVCMPCYDAYWENIDKQIWKGV